MSYLSKAEVKKLERLLHTFFALPYSTDLDGKDAETLLRIVKNATGPHSKRKELFDIIDGNVGYSVKTLFKAPNSKRVDLQEQRFCDVEEVRRMRAEGGSNAAAQGRILLGYMHERIKQQMDERGIKVAKSLILLKHWNKKHRSKGTHTEYDFLYWEEDFLGFITELIERDEAGEIEWVMQDAGLHARDKSRVAPKGGRSKGELEAVRLLRMHYKHNQIFTDHDIPANATRIAFKTRSLNWEEIMEIIETQPGAVEIIEEKVESSIIEIENTAKSLKRNSQKNAA